LYGVVVLWFIVCIYTVFRVRNKRVLVVCYYSICPCIYTPKSYIVSWYVIMVHGRVYTVFRVRSFSGFGESFSLRACFPFDGASGGLVDRRRLDVAGSVCLEDIIGCLEVLLLLLLLFFAESGTVFRTRQTIFQTSSNAALQR